MTKAYSQLTITDLTDKQTYIKYSASATTGAIYDSPNNIKGIIYIGICTVTAENAPTDRTKYTWSQLTGSKGDSGSPGVASTVSSSVTSYCRASNGTGSAPEKIDTSIGTSGWQSTVPETNVDYPYLWTRVVISYTNTKTTSTAYSVSSTMDSIEIGGANLLFDTQNYKNFGMNLGSKYNAPRKEEGEWLNNKCVIFTWQGLANPQPSSPGTWNIIYWDNRNNQLMRNTLLPNKEYVFSYDWYLDIEEENLSNNYYINVSYRIMNHGSQYSLVQKQKVIRKQLVDKKLGWKYYHDECIFTTVDENSPYWSSEYDVNSQYIMLPFYISGSCPSGTKLFITNVKLEQGNKSTSWEPANKDVSLEIQSIAAALGFPTVSTNPSKYSGKSGFDPKTGAFVTHFISTSMIQTDAVRSSNLSTYYDDNNTLRVKTDGEGFSESGSFFDLADGQIYSPNFIVDGSGNAKIRGNIQADSGSIGGFNIRSGVLETSSSNIHAGIAGVSNSYNGNNILWAGADVIVDNKNNPTGITNAKFSVDVNGNITANSGTLGGITINNTGIHSKTVDINNDGSFNIGNKLVFENNALSLNGLNLSLNSFDTDIQNQIVKTKYITAENGQIIFSEVDSSKKPTGSKVILSATDGLKIQDQGNNDKVIVSNAGVIVGSKNSSYVDITDSNVGIWNSNALGIAIDSTSINFTKNAGKNLASKDKTTFFNDSDGVENGYTYSGKAGRGAGIKIAAAIFERGHSYVLSFKFQKISSDVSLTAIGGHAHGFTTNKIIINGIIILGSRWGDEHKIEDSLDAQSCQVYLTFNGGTDDDNLYIQPQRGNYHPSDNIQMKYWDIKVEEGNKATAWTPAPQDSDRDEEPNTLSIKVDPDNYNLPTITLGDSNGGNGKSLEISDSGIVMRAGITENIVENEKTKKKITKNKQLFSIGEKGFVFGDTSVPSNSGTYFSIGKNFAYDENIGLALSMDAANLLWKSSNLKASALWEKDSQTNEDKDPINILITEHGMGFFKKAEVSDPIAYFSNNKFYVKRTQVVERQEISGFQWFVRNGSEYVTKEDGTVLHNLGLKWVG